MSLTTASPVLVSLIESIRQAVRSGTDDGEVAGRVADLLEPCLRSDEFLTEAQREPDPDHYRQHVLHVEKDGSFSIVALVWLPGQETPIHDCVSLWSFSEPLALSWRPENLLAS